MQTSNIHIIILAVIPILVIQASWIFFDARKRGENAILWALFGLLNAPSSLIIYLLVTRIGKRNCPSCSKVVEKKFNNCPFCNHKLNKTCSSCMNKLDEGWTFCPNCSDIVK